ncbi:transposase [Salmonella enterica subsp. enterica serovar Newport str. SL317]|nr:transposase [Salmonella enterica subsp. enterica serovar Newport str. SL317]
MAHDNRSSAKEPWLIFSNINDITPRSIMKLYSRRMQIEQNFSYPRPLSTHVPGAVLKSLVLLN